MVDQLLETRTPFQLPRASAISPDALVTFQEGEDGPVQSIELKKLLGRLIQTDTAKETRADLLADLGHDDSSVALVFADPDPAQNGWYRKIGAADEGTWIQFEKLSDQAAAEVAEYVDAAAQAALAAEQASSTTQALTNFRPTLAAGIADFVVGEFFSSAEFGELRLYERIAIAPYYTDLGDSVAPLTTAALASSTGADKLGIPTPPGTAYLTMLSDITNNVPIDAMRFIPRAKHASIRDKSNADDLYAQFTDMAGAFGNGGHLHFPIGAYHYSGSWYFTATDNLRISGEGMGRTVLSQVEVGPRNGLRIASSTDGNNYASLTYYPIDGAAARGSMSVTLATPGDAAHFIPGDMAWIRCRKTVSDANDTPVAELVEILSANQITGLVVFAAPLLKDYAPDTSGTIYTYGLAVADGYGTPIRNIHIHDLTLRNLGGENYVLWLRHALDARIERVQTFGRAGITASSGCTGTIVDQCDVNIINEIFDNYLYFFAVDHGSSRTLVDRTTFRSTGAGSFHVHEGSADLILQRCRFLMAATSAVPHSKDWPVISIAGSSWDVRILDNLFVNAPFGLLRASNSWKYGAAPYNERQHRGLRFNGNIAKGEFGRDVNTPGIGDQGVLIDSQCTGFEVCNNELDFTLPAGGNQIKLSSEGTCDGNRFSGTVSIATVVQGSNIRLSGAGAATDQPIWRNYGAATARGPSLEATEAGQTTPRFYIGNSADGNWCAIYGNGTSIDFATGAMRGSTSGTSRVRIGPTGLDILGASGRLGLNGGQLLTPRKTGWAAATGSATRTTFDTASVTLPQLAERVKALIDDLHASTGGHGLIGT